MPYIKEEDRKRLEFYCDLNGDLDVKIKTSGELNYLFTIIALTYLEQNGKSYQRINDILGALDGASKEFYRRVAVPYEEEKITLNGDVY